MFHRSLKAPSRNSFFLFGARGTGKSTWIREYVVRPRSAGESWVVDLLDETEVDRFARDPRLLQAHAAALGKGLRRVVLDEIQRVPSLLNHVQKMMIDPVTRHLQFIMTGSSARKLRRGKANLLAGRAWVKHLHPLTRAELAESFDLDRALSWGSLPGVWTAAGDSDRAETLRAYGLTYLREEIQLEQVVRRLDPFRSFLEVAAQSNGKILNHSRISRDVGADVKTVQSYFQILEDTWIGFHLPAYHRSVRKAQRSHSKFYFFDPGVARALARSLGAPLSQGTGAYGEAFEHWVILEFHRENDYRGSDFRLSYLGTPDGAEVDLVLDRPGSSPWFVEIKSTMRVDAVEVRKLRRLATAHGKARALYLSRDPISQVVDGIECHPWHDGLKRVFAR